MAVGTQRLTIDEDLGDGRQQLFAAGPHQLGADRGRGQLDQQHVIQADPVEGIFQGEHALDLVSNDHRVQYRTHAQRRFALGHALLRQVVGHGEDAAEVVRRMPPLGRQPGVVVVQPAHAAADVPGRLERIETERGARHARAVWHDGALDQRPEVLAALGKTQGQQTAAEAVEQAVARGVQGLGGLDLVVQDIVGDVLDHLVIVGASVQVDIGAHR
ncbi:hypothetical protein D3C84_375390 [compost metagenome]